MALLTISHVTRRYGRIAANRDISFTVEPGQIAFIMKDSVPPAGQQKGAHPWKTSGF